MDETITALIPTFQRPVFLKRAVLSVLGQTYTHVQVSVFDNASQDETESIMQTWTQHNLKINYHRHEKNIGSLKNFKYAFNSITTPYFSVLSDDDFLAPDFYESAINVLKQHPHVMFVILNTLVVDENMQLTGYRKSTGKLSIYDDDQRFNAFQSNNLPTTWVAMLFRKEVGEIYNKMDDQYDVAADMRFLLLAAARFPFAYLSKAGAFFTVHPASFSTSRKTFNLIHDGITISRYIELYHDSFASSIAKDHAYSQIKAILNQSRKPWRRTMSAMQNAIKNICENTPLNDSLGENETKNAKHAGFILTSKILAFIYNNPIMRWFIYCLFLRYYKKRKAKHQSAMLTLQQGELKKIFADVKNIVA